jgi:hypothetical protein
MISLLALAMLLQTAPAQTTPGAWAFRETANAETGAKAASATARDASNGARLIVRCDVGKESIVSVQFIPKPPLAAGSTRLITLTIDNAKAEMSNWELPGLGAYVDDPATVFIYAQEFAKAKTLQIGLANDAGEPIGAEFVGPGNDAMFRKVFAACGRPYEMPVVTAANP